MLDPDQTSRTAASDQGLQRLPKPVRIHRVNIPLLIPSKMFSGSVNGLQGTDQTAWICTLI